MTEELGNDAPSPVREGPTPGTAPRRHRFLIGTLFVVATVVGIVAVLTVCANRQALLVIWGPAPAFRQLGYIIAFAVLLALGVHSLRRQTAGEFPDAQAGDDMDSIRSWNAARQQPPAPVPVAAGGNGSRLSELERLARLHDKGSLSDAEFAAEKAALNDRS